METRLMFGAGVGVRTTRDPTVVYWDGEPLDRQRFWDGRFLTARDLEHHQSALIRHSEYHQRWAHGPGVRWGLRIREQTDAPDGKTCITIDPGMAYDCCGATLLLTETRTVRVPIDDRRFRHGAGDECEGFVLGRRDHRRSDPVPALYQETLPATKSPEYGRYREDVEFVVLPPEMVAEESWPLGRDVSSADCVADLPVECLDPCTTICPCGHGLLLARVRWRSSAGGLVVDRPHRPVLTGPVRLTRIINHNWPHGGQVSLERLRSEADMKGHLTITFSRSIKPAEGAARGINRWTFAVAYIGAGGTLEQIMPPDPEDQGREDLPTPRLSPDGRRAFFEIPPALLHGRTSVVNTRVFVTVRCDFLEDGRGYAVGAHQGPGPDRCPVEGGRFESWFDVVERERIFSVLIDPKNVTLAPGDSIRLQAHITDEAGNAVAGSPRWMSENPEVAEVDDTGSVTAGDEGQSRVSATYRSAVDTAHVSVVRTPLPTDPFTWTPMPSPIGEDLRAVWGRSGTDVFAVGLHGAILHFDGDQWETRSSVAESESLYLYGVWGTPSDLFVVGKRQDASETGSALGTILRFDESDWAEVFHENKVSFRGIWAASSQSVFAVGGRGTIVHWDGETWTKQSGIPNKPLHGVWGSSSDDVYVIGSDGLVLHWDGEAWSGEETATTQSLWAVWGASSSDVVVAGTNGTILRRDAEGKWSAQDGGTDEWIVDVWGTSKHDVFALTARGTILHDDGDGWSVQTATVATKPHAVWGPSVLEAFLVADEGVILRGTRSHPHAEPLTEV